MKGNFEVYVTGSVRRFFWEYGWNIEEFEEDQTGLSSSDDPTTTMDAAVDGEAEANSGKALTLELVQTWSISCVQSDVIVSYYFSYRPLYINMFL